VDLLITCVAEHTGILRRSLSSDLTFHYHVTMNYLLTKILVGEENKN